MPKEASNNERKLIVDPGVANEQEDFALDGTPPDIDTKGAIPDPGDGYQGQPVDFASVAPYRYPGWPDGIDSHALPHPLA